MTPTPAPNPPMDVSKRNRQLVERYFREIVDGRSIATIEEIFHPECRISRADRPAPLCGLDALRRFFRMSITAVPSIQTTIHSIICDDHDSVATHVSHTVRFGRVVITPIGVCFANGRTAKWQAMALFRIKDDRILEEFVIRDEVSILRQLEMLPRAASIRDTVRNLLRRLTQRSNRVSEMGGD